MSRGIKTGGIVLVLALLTGCTGSLQQARVSGTLARQAGTLSAASVERCEDLDSQHRWAGAVGKGAGLLGTGLAATAGSQEFQDDPDPTLQKGLMIGAAVSAAVAGGALLLSEDSAAAYVRECSGEVR